MLFPDVVSEEIVLGSGKARIYEHFLGDGSSYYLASVGDAFMRCATLDEAQCFVADKVAELVPVLTCPVCEERGVGLGESSMFQDPSDGLWTCGYCGYTTPVVPMEEEDELPPVTRPPRGEALMLAKSAASGVRIWMGELTCGHTWQVQTLSAEAPGVVQCPAHGFQAVASADLIGRGLAAKVAYYTTYSIEQDEDGHYDVTTFWADTGEKIAEITSIAGDASWVVYDEDGEEVASGQSPSQEDAYSDVEEHPQFQREARVAAEQIQGPHCELCGRVNPETHDGYTDCCNELVCDGDGGYQSEYGVPGNSVWACCWAQAEREFGGRDKVPEGSYRLRLSARTAAWQSFPGGTCEFCGEGASEEKGPVWLLEDVLDDEDDPDLVFHKDCFDNWKPGEPVSGDDDRRRAGRRPKGQWPMRTQK